MMLARSHLFRIFRKLFSSEPPKCEYCAVSRQYGKRSPKVLGYRASICCAYQGGYRAASVGVNQQVPLLEATSKRRFPFHDGAREAKRPLEPQTQTCFFATPPDPAFAHPSLYGEPI